MSHDEFSKEDVEEILQRVEELRRLDEFYQQENRKGYEARRRAFIYEVISSPPVRWYLIIASVSIAVTLIAIFIIIFALISKTSLQEILLSSFSIIIAILAILLTLFQFALPRQRKQP